MYFFNKYVLLYLIINLKESFSNSSFANFNYTNIYGDDYGKTWIFMPDGDGNPHYVNLRNHENKFATRNTLSDNIEYRLYKGNDSETYILLNEWAQPLYETSQNGTIIVSLHDKPLKIITHGWKSSADHEGVTILKNAYIESRKVNVITIDWYEIADSIFYPWVVNETKAIGTKVATFIQELHNKYNVSGNQLHLIGHSLGAHIMGIAASKSNIKVDRITGLDPARPLFEYPFQGHLNKLDPSDANFVDVIHTCSGVLGYEAPIGTVDFYPNNGIPPQPGCASIQKIFEACSHGRSFDYFTESVKYPFSFRACKCQNWFEYIINFCSEYAYMGEYVNRNTKGKYYLKTNGNHPFGYKFP